jgi:hypothetical protein
VNGAGIDKRPERFLADSEEGGGLRKAENLDFAPTSRAVTAFVTRGHLCALPPDLCDRDGQLSFRCALPR